MTLLRLGTLAVLKAAEGYSAKLTETESEVGEAE